MNSNNIRISLAFLAAAGAIVCDPLVQTSIAAETAQTSRLTQLAQATTGPQPAPSFLKQAGQMILDSAQKQVLHGVNERLQTPAPSTQTSTQSPSDATTVQAPAPKQGAPCRTWVDPRERPLACLLCIHGLGLQSNSYEFFGKEQANRGLAVYAIDVRGFGSWMKANGKTQVNFDECLADIKQALESIRAANPGLPVYILGESMGGAIALRAASMYPDLIDGLISSVPAGERFHQGKTSMKVFLNLLSGFDVANVGNDVLNQATQNAKLKALWSGDPLARLNLTPQELIQFQDFMNNNHEAAKKVTDMPVLFLQGNGDQLVKPEGTWELFNAVAAKDKSFFAVPGEHLIFEEAQAQDPGPRDQNFRVISSWLATKVGRRNRFGRGPIVGAAGGPGAYPGRGMGGGAYPGGGMGGGAYPGGGMGGGAYPGGGIGGGAYPGGGMGGGAYGGGMGGGMYPRRRPYFNTQGLEGPAQMLESGRYADAILELEQIRIKRPTDPNVLGMLGQAYYRNGQPDKAGYFFRSAMRLGRAGGEQSQAMNSYLIDMSREAQATPPASDAPRTGTSAISMLLPFLGFGGRIGPPTGPTQPISTAGSGAGVAAGAGDAGGAYAKGKVYAFFANWADQCKGMGTLLNQLGTAYGNAVDIVRVDIENPASDALVDQFKVGPIPTVVFVAPNGQVYSTIIGETDYGNYEAAARAIAQASVGTR